MRMFICSQCVGDPILSSRIKEEGNISQCSYCNRVEHLTTLETLSKHLHYVIQEQFVLTPETPVEWEEHWDYDFGNWQRKGEDARTLIADLAQVDDRIANDVANHLSDRLRYYAVKNGEEDPFGYEACYEEREPADLQFHDAWNVLRVEIIERARYFSHKTEELLNHAFGDLLELKTADGKQVVREYHSEDPRSSFWRARRVVNDDDLDAMLKDPAQELGPPPSAKAKSGRMNPRGVSVFYGAENENVCVSELRPPVGSKVVMGKFDLMRTVRLLDLRAMTEVYAGGSRFDPSYEERRGRVSFLRQLVSEISKPVVPEDEELEYIPTQAVAEYLAHRANPTVDGILYPSSQADGNGLNVVLFNHACGVKPYLIPVGTEINIYDWTTVEDDDDSNFAQIIVDEVVPDDAPPTEEPAVQKATLEISIDNVKVLNIRSVTYNNDSFFVTRTQTKKSHEERFLANFAEIDGHTFLDESERGPF